MLPMATPPNAIVFASGYIKVHEMARAGVILKSNSSATINRSIPILFYPFYFKIS